MRLEIEGINYPCKNLANLRKHDRLLVVSTGRRVWEDVERSGWDRGLGMDILCVKDAIIHFPGNVHHGFGEHPDQLMLLRGLRRARRKIMAAQTTQLRLHTSKSDHEKVHGWGIPQFGCSGMGAALIGVLMGYEQVVLAGVHLDNSGHYYDPHWMKTTFDTQYRDVDGAPRVWKGVNERYFKGKVKALSGRLAEYLGEP